MKKNIKHMLNQNYDNQNKADLVKLLGSFSELIGSEAYSKVSGVDPKTELDKLTKKELISTIDEFKSQYNPLWENNLANATSKVIESIFGQIESDEAHFGIMAGAGDSDFTTELGSIDFENIIGGPLNAAVSAQNNASLATVDFIKKVGFDDNREIRMVDFSYTKQVPVLIPDPNHADPNTPAPLIPDPNGATEPKEIEIKVPFISILNVPSLRIETVEIDFNVKLNSVHTKDTSSEFGIDAEYSKELSIGKIYNTKMKVSVSYKRTTSIGVKVEKEYSLNVKVKATNDEMPAGLEKVLGLLSA